MGAADVVPGVSGGTIALITGIYERLVDALSSATPRTAGLLIRGQFVLFWETIDGAFVVALLAGILTSVVTLARVVGALLDTSPQLIWASSVAW